MRRETELFFESIMREDRSVLDLLRADYTFLNERLAKHYGIPNVYGSYFRRVTLAVSVEEFLEALEAIKDRGVNANFNDPVLPLQILRGFLQIPIDGSNLWATNPAG